MTGAEAKARMSGGRAWVGSLVLAGILALGALAQSGPAAAQNYPNRPIRVIVPFAAGSATDIVARAFGDRMSQTLGQSLVIENRPGANGMIGASAVAKADADGYTILIGTNSTNAAAPALFNNVPFDMHRDFQPVSFLCSVPLIVAVSNEVPAKTLAELIALAKTRTDLTFASASASQRVSTEMLLAMTGIKMTHVPYRQGPAAMQDLIANRVTLFTADLGVMLPQVRANTVRALAVTSTTRSPQFPDLPTVDEAAGVKGYELIAWFAMFTPTGVPAEVVTKLNAAVRAAATAPELQNALSTSLGMQIAPSTPEELAERVRVEAVKWMEAAAVAGIEKQ
ncbi:MAG: tripartite tricarboxylate transporter substrate binding protein [Rhizobiales bacterium]|nr:tripartite tricarboxylate transporter substrate binding protein [Hyphomicrobiales bacterium]